MSKGVLIPRIRLTLFSCAFLSCSSVRMNQSLILPSSILPSCSSSFFSSSSSSFVLSCPFGLSATVCRLHEPSSIHGLQGFVVPYGRVTGSFEYQARFQSFLRTRKNYSWERLQVSHTSTMHTVWVPLRVSLGAHATGKSVCVRCKSKYIGMGINKRKNTLPLLHLHLRLLLGKRIKKKAI